MKKKTLLLALLVLMGVGLVNAQNRVTGTVSSADDGSRLSYVTVLVKGTSIVAMTNDDGTYTITAPTGNETLVFSFAGMVTQEVNISNRAIIDVIMTTDATQLDEAMVVAYGVATRRSFTGSATSVKADKIATGSPESIDKALNGKVAGLRSTSVTGDPGSSGSITIRGVGSINASTQPLYVIDGVAVLSNSDMVLVESYKSNNTLSSLNPEDVESVTVLKDAAAASLYGSRAANGVILITTKKGRQGKTRFNYSGEFGQSSMASNSFELMNPSDMAEFEKAALFGYYLNRGVSAMYPNQANYANRESYYADARAFAEANTRSDFVVNPNMNTDWRDIIYGKAFRQDHQFSMSGGNENTQFYVGLGYNHTEGIVKGSEFDRYSFRMNLDHKANRWLDLSLRQMVSYTNQNGFRDKSGQASGISNSSPLGILLSMNPSVPEYGADGEPTMNASLPGSNNTNPHYMLTSETGRYSSSNQTESFRNMTSAVLGVRFTPWLRFTETAGLDVGFDQMLDRWAPESVDGASIGGLGDRRTRRGVKITTSSLLNFNHSFNNHNVAAIVGFEAEKYTTLNLWESADNYSTWKLPELANGQPRSVGSTKSAYTMASALGNVNYNYDNKYFISGSLRTDGSSRLSKDERWGAFWSVSGAWNLAREEFMQASWLNDLRLKVSYGTNGTLPAGYYSYMPLYYFGGGYGASSAIYWYALGNEGLTWEKSNTLNVGLETQLFSKLGFSIEYYKKQTKDLLMSLQTSYLSGFGSYTANNGEISNNGVEIELRAINITAGDFSWNGDFNIAFQKAKVDKLPDGTDVYAGHDNQYIYREGEDMWSFYLPEWAGVDPETGVGLYYVDRTVNDDKTHIVGNAARNIVGKATPDFLGGFSSTFAFKGIDLYFLITYQFGADAFDYPGYFMRHDGNRLYSIMASKDVAGNYWTPENRNAENPQPVYSPTYRTDAFSSRHIVSTDFIRMKEISVGYNFPKKIVEKMYLDNLRVFFKTVNPFMIWQKTDDIDPEVNMNGYRTTDTPAIRTWSFGINVSF